MAENAVIWVPLSDWSLICPACSEEVDILSAVQINDAEVVQTSDARRSGPAEFGATVDTNVLGVSISHNCVVYPEPEEDEENLIRAPRGGIRYNHLRQPPPGIYRQRGTNRLAQVRADD